MNARPDRGFTLVELLASIAILLLIMLVLVSITESTRRMWTYTNGKIEEFREARDAFEAVTRNLSQATLNTYWDYEYPVNSGGTPDTTQIPARYIRQSELRFLSGNASKLTGDINHPSHAVFFQVPLGVVNSPDYGRMYNLLNTWGFFIEFGSDKNAGTRPQFLDKLNPPVPDRYRFRLMEMMEDSDSLTLYKYSNGHPEYTGHEWFTRPLQASPRPIRAVAENIVAMILLPKLTPEEDPTGVQLAPSYQYDSTASNADPRLNSKNQLPPMVQVTMIAVDDGSFSRLQGGAATKPELYDPDAFKNAANCTADLNQVEDSLREKKLNYRVFTTNVSLKGAKWSREQSN